MARTGSVPYRALYGEEDFFLDEQVRLLEEGRNPLFTLQLHASDVTPQEAVVCAQQVHWDGEQAAWPLVIVEDAQKWKDVGALGALCESKDHPQHTVLVCVLRTAKLPAGWAKALQSPWVHKEYKPLKLQERSNEVAKWLQDRAGKYGLVLSQELAQGLASAVGNDLYQLDSELQKVQLLTRSDTAGTPTVIKREHIQMLLTAFRPVEPYQIADAALKRQRPQVLALVERLYKAMGDEALLPITFAMMRATERALVVRTLYDQTADVGEMADAANMPTWVFQQQYLPQVVKPLPAKALIALMGRLRRLDANLKMSLAAKRARVETTLLSL